MNTSALNIGFKVEVFYLGGIEYKKA